MFIPGSIILSRCYVIKGSYLKLLNDVFEYSMNIWFLMQLKYWWIQALEAFI